MAASTMMLGRLLCACLLLVGGRGWLQSLDCSSAPSKEPRAETSGWHLMLLMQGLAGNGSEPSTVSLLAQDICGLVIADGDRRTAVVVVHPVAAPMLTQGQQAADDVVEFLEGHAREGQHFADFSVIGHSLGGLVARVMVQRLAVAMPQLAPRAYVSLFTPHAGLPESVAKQLKFMFEIGSPDDNGLRELLDLGSEGVLLRAAGGDFRQALLRFNKRTLVGAFDDWLLDYESATLSSAEAPEQNSTSSTGGALNLRTVHRGSVPCEKGLPRSAVICELADVPFRRVGVDWSLTQPGKMELKVMSQVERMELLRDLLPDLTVQSTLSRGQPCEKSTLRCSTGLMCEQGICQTVAFGAEEVCNTGSQTVCSTAVGLINEVLEDWHLIITSSGGGGHIAAAENLKKIISQDVQDRYTKAMKVLQGHKLHLKPEAFSRLNSALQGAKAEAPHVQVVDIMKSNCMSIDGKGNLFMGDWMTQAWNEKQTAGDIDGLKQLIELQPLTQVILGKQCETVLQDYMSGKGLGFRRPATGLHSTQPLFIDSLSKAAEKMGVRTVNLYTTDLPTPACVHFFKPLKSFARSGKAERVVLHSIMPLNGVRELTKLSGLQREQIKIDRFMPVDPKFVTNELPLPHQATGLLLRAQLPEESRFLQTVGNPIVVGEGDEVLLVMLGSQPTLSAVREYSQVVRRLRKPARRRYVFIACGNPRIRVYANLYRQLVAEAGRSNTGNNIVVPFTGQDAKAIFGRATAVIIRSGGMSSGEALALRSRHSDHKRIFLHAEPISREAVERAENKVKYGFADWDDLADGLSVWAMAALDEGMVPWEAGNARYLIERVGATLVTTQTFLRQWSETTNLHVGRDVQAFLLKQPEVCAKLACTREAEPLLVEQFARGKRSCEVALNVFEGAERDVVLDSHRCGRTLFVVRRVEGAAPSFLKFGTSADKAAAGVAAACGGKVLSCGDFVAVAVEDK